MIVLKDMGCLLAVLGVDEMTSFLVRWENIIILACNFARLGTFAFIFYVT
jgi:hypothetical protein